MKAREYCCCAIPMVNAGIYATLIEQLSLGILVGTLSIATPSIVGASTPSFSTWILGIISYLAAGVQLIGFMGVLRESPSLYGKYVTLHGILASIAFSVAAAWIIMSASRHTYAKAKCINDFFPDTSSSEGDTLCNIFPWVDVGIMGALWAILAILHVYFFFGLSSYGKSQRNDHDQYDRVYQPLTAENIPNNSEPWDSRPSADYDGNKTTDYKHLRNESTVSSTDVFAEQPKEVPSNYDYPNAAIHEDSPNPSFKSSVYEQAPMPTNYFDDNDSDVKRPTQAQGYPAEGSFVRKMPHLYNPREQY